LAISTGSPNLPIGVSCARICFIRASVPSVPGVLMTPGCFTTATSAYEEQEELGETYDAIATDVHPLASTVHRGAFCHDPHGALGCRIRRRAGSDSADNRCNTDEKDSPPLRQLPERNKIQVTLRCLR
jgi:hypothetical protein